MGSGLRSQGLAAAGFFGGRGAESLLWVSGSGT